MTGNWIRYWIKNKMHIMDYVKNVEDYTTGHAKAINSAINRAMASTRTFAVRTIKSEQNFIFPSKYIKIKKSTYKTLNGSLWISTKTNLSHKFFKSRQNKKGVVFGKPYKFGEYQIDKTYPSAFIPKNLKGSPNVGNMAFVRTGESRYPIEIVAETPPITVFLEKVDSNKVRDNYLKEFAKRYEHESKRLTQKHTNKIIESNLIIKI